MKTTWKNLLLLMLPLALFSLSSCDDDAPEEENEAETITTIRLSFAKSGGATSTFTAKDADGAGPSSIVIDDITLAPNSTYNVTLSLLNELETPAEDISVEVDEEGDEHQVFYAWSGGLLSSFAYDDKDDNDLPVGLKTVITTDNGGVGTLKVTLKHQPDGIKKATSTAADGETDVEVTFNVVVGS